MRKTVAGQWQSFHAAIRVGCLQRIEDNIVPNGLVEFVFRRPDQGSGGIIEKLPFGVILGLLLKEYGTLKPLEELGSRTGPVTYFNTLSAPQDAPGLTSEWPSHRRNE